MSDIAALVLRMARLGAPAEAIAVAIEAIEAACETDRERRRRNTERMRFVRAQCEHSASTVQTQCANKESFPIPLQRNNLTNSTRSIESPLAVKQESKMELVERGKRGSRLSPEWQPRADEIEFARVECKLTEQETLKIRDEFVDFWIAVPGSRGVKLNWNSTFRNRLRTIAQRGAQHETDRDKHSISRAAGRLAGSGIDFGPRPSILPLETCGDIVRLLPERRSG